MTTVMYQILYVKPSLNFMQALNQGRDVCGSKIKTIT